MQEAQELVPGCKNMGQRFWKNVGKPGGKGTLALGQHLSSQAFARPRKFRK